MITHTRLIFLTPHILHVPVRTAYISSLSGARGFALRFAPTPTARTRVGLCLGLGREGGVRWRAAWRMATVTGSAGRSEVWRWRRGVASEARRAARMAYPEKLTIYHAGTGRTTFLACLKLTTIFVFVFFSFLAAPSYVKAGSPMYETAGIVLCGIIPLVFVAYSSASFVSSVAIHLPPFSRTTTEMLRRFVANPPPATHLELSTMSFIGKPRVSSLRVGDLNPAKKRFGMVNYVRNTAEANKGRKWWMFRAVGNFHIQEGKEGKTKHGWVWKEVAASIEKRAKKKT